MEKQQEKRLREGYERLLERLQEVGKQTFHTDTHYNIVLDFFYTPSCLDSSSISSSSGSPNFLK